MASESKDEDRLFVRDGWRHYRRRYSVVEVRWGLVTLAVLLVFGGWIWWRGHHPLDPSLFSDGASLLKTATPKTVVSAEPATSAPAAAAPAAPTTDRGPLPATLAGAGWREDKITQFDPENLYVKIDGRADWFKGFGFRRLYSVLLVSEKDPATTVDVEMYDLAKTENALGAYGGERAPDAKPEVSEGGLHHLARNALYMARGQYFVRVIGSDETPAITEKLRALIPVLSTGIKGDPLPWAYGYFVGGLGLDPGAVSYAVANAFSFSFARDVWSARPKGKNDDLELFVAAKASAAEARKLTEQLHKGFLGFGAAAGKLSGVPLVKDQFLNAFTAVKASDRFVLGVRGAATKEMLGEELGKLETALAKLPAAVKDRARPAENDQGGGDER
jgi:hypothetical protein